MKIVLFTYKTDEKDGWGSYSAALAAGLRDVGHEVVLVTGDLRDGALGVLPRPTRFKLCYLGAPLYVYKLWRRRKYFADADIIHCLVEPYAFIATLTALVFSIRTTLITVHGSFGVKMLGNPVFAILQRFAYRQAARIVCVSSFTERVLRRRVGNRETIVINNGIDESQIATARQGTPQPSLIGVGAIKTRKGYLEALRVIAILKTKLPNIIYTIVGAVTDELYHAKLHGYITKHDLQDNVRILRGVAEVEKRKLLTEASLFFLLPVSTETDFEGFGLVYLEANALGLPVVGSLDSGAEDAIARGESGFLVNPNDAAGVASAIHNLLENPAEYARISQGAVAWARRSTWKIRITEYDRLYQHLLGTNQRKKILA